LVRKRRQREMTLVKKSKMGKKMVGGKPGEKRAE